MFFRWVRGWMLLEASADPGSPSNPGPRPEGSQHRLLGQVALYHMPFKLQHKQLILSPHSPSYHCSFSPGTPAPHSQTMQCEPPSSTPHQTVTKEAVAHSPYLGGDTLVHPVGEQVK